MALRMSNNSTAVEYIWKLMAQLFFLYVKSISIGQAQEQQPMKSIIIFSQTSLEERREELRGKSEETTKK